MLRIVTFLLLAVCVSFSASANKDSIGIKTIAGKTYILHKVTKGEGLYGLSKRYNVTIKQIEEADPSVKQGISPNQIVLIPYIKPQKNASGANNKTEPKQEKKPEVKTEKKSASEEKKKPETTNNNNRNQVKKPVMHTVEAGETLYRISVKYKVSVDEISKWNKLKNNEISVGQQLIVGYNSVKENNKPLADGSKKSELNDSKENSGTKDDFIAEKYRKELADAQKKEAEKKAKGQWKEITESGVATWIDDGSIVSEKKLALHKTAPIGTVIQLTNPMNNEKVYVKVVGRLQPSEDEANVVIKITKSTAGKLGLRDKYFRLDMSYGVEVIK